MEELIIKGNRVEATLRTARFTDGDFIIVECPALNIVGYGKSENEAHQSFETQLEIFLEDTAKRGTLVKVLLKLGWVHHCDHVYYYKEPKPETMDIPTGLLKTNVSGYTYAI